MVVTEGHLSSNRETPVSLLIVLLALLPFQLDSYLIFSQKGTLCRLFFKSRQKPKAVSTSHTDQRWLILMCEAPF